MDKSKNKTKVGVKGALHYASDYLDKNINQPIKKASLDLLSNVSSGSADISEQLGYDIAPIYLNSWGDKLKKLSDKIPENDGLVPWLVGQTPEALMLLSNHPVIKGPALVASAVGAYGDILNKQEENGYTDRLLASTGAAANTVLNLAEFEGLKGVLSNIGTARKAYRLRDLNRQGDIGKYSGVKMQLTPDPTSGKLKPHSKRSLRKIGNNEVSKAGAKAAGNAGLFLGSGYLNDRQKEFFGSLGSGE